MGLDRSYLILRVLPVDTLDLTAAQVDAIVDHPQVRKVYQAIVARVLADGHTTLALTIGPRAKRLAPHVLPTTVPVVELMAWKTPGALANWKSALQQLQGMSYAKDLPATFSYNGERAQIARIDLPYGTLRWMGSSGDRAVRAQVSGKPSPHYYKILMPRWAFNLGPRPLSDAEEQAIEQEL
jgi:hypothetical protein